MALGTELFNLATSYDPYGAFKEGQRAPAEQELKDIAVQEQIKDARAEQTASLQQMPGMNQGGLAQQAKTTVPSSWKLTDSQGMPTVAGQINTYKTQATEEQAYGMKLLKQANYTTDPKEKAVLTAQGRLFINKAVEFNNKASEIAQKTQNAAIYGLATANNKTEWDNIVKSWENNGFPIPQGFPTEYSPENQKKVQQMAPAELQSKINTDLRNREKEQEESIIRKQKIRKGQAAEQNGETAPQVTTKLVDGKTVPLSTDEKLNNPKYGIATGKVSTDDKKVARRVNTDSQLIVSSLDDVMVINEKGTKPLTGSTFSNLGDKGLITAPAKALTNSLSDEDALMYDSAVGPAIREMVQFMMPDYRPTDAAFVKAEQIYKARSGEPYIVQLQKMAKLRQDFENIGTSYLDSGIMNATQAAQFKANLKKSREMVPWSVQDVSNFKTASEKNPNLTFQEFLKSKGEKPSSSEKPAESKSATEKKTETVSVNGKTYSRPPNMSDKDWADYKESVKAK
jgi:hypothetical protein